LGEEYNEEGSGSAKDNGAEKAEEEKDVEEDRGECMVGMAPSVRRMIAEPSRKEQQDISDIATGGKRKPLIQEIE